MSMDSEDGFERGFARGWEAAMARAAQAKREDDLRAVKAAEAQQVQISKMQGVRAGQ